MQERMMPDPEEAEITAPPGRMRALRMSLMICVVGWIALAAVTTIWHVLLPQSAHALDVPALLLGLLLIPVSVLDALSR